MTKDMIYKTNILDKLVPYDIIKVSSVSKVGLGQKYMQ